MLRAAEKALGESSVVSEKGYKGRETCEIKYREQLEEKKRVFKHWLRTGSKKCERG